MVPGARAQGSPARRPSRALAWPAAWLGLMLVILCVRGFPVPTDNEHLYLLLLVKAAHPEFLAGDWTFSEPWRTHWVFNALASPFARVLPLEVLGWSGRLLAWSLSAFGILALGRVLGLGAGAAAAAGALWLACGQSLAAGSWMIGTLEAKVFAYALLLFALAAFAGARSRLGAALLGCAFSLHPAVGLWGGVGLAAGVLATRPPWRRLLGDGLLVVLFALPGALAVLSAATGGEAIRADDWRFVSRVAMAGHMDPFGFPLRNLVAAVLLLAFNALHAWERRADHAFRLLLGFELALAAVFAAGFAARFLELDRFLNYYPFRLFPLLVPLLFFLHLFAWFAERKHRPLRRLAAATALLALLALPNPLGGLVDAARENVGRWNRAESDFARAARWIAEGTPRDAVVIAPPWEREAFFLMRRPQIVNWFAFPSMDRVPEWRRRLRRLVGEVPPGTTAERLEAMQRHYEALGADEIERVARDYGASFLVTRTAQPRRPLLFQAGAYRVYALRPQTPGTPGAAAGGPDAVRALEVPWSVWLDS